MWTKGLTLDLKESSHRCACYCACLFVSIAVSKLSERRGSSSGIGSVSGSGSGSGATSMYMCKNDSDFRSDGFDQVAKELIHQYGPHALEHSCASRVADTPPLALLIHLLSRC